LTSWNSETDIFQDWSIRVVTERDILEFNITPFENQGFRIG
jgi:hypothetical protein